MFKRVFLFLAMNLAVIIVVSIIIAILESVFGINISAYGASYTGLFIFALLFGFTGSFISLFLSKWLAKKAHKIQILQRGDVYNLGGKEKIVWTTVEELAERNHIKMPEVGIYNSTEPNAFATGATKNSSLVAVSTGLLERMNKEEIEGVVGHEMAHIINGDMVTMSLLQGVLNTFVIFFARILANVVDNAMSDNEENSGPSLAYYAITIVFEIIFGVLASIIAMKFSRYREFQADKGSATFLGKEKMIKSLRALQKLEPIMLTVDGKDKMANFKISSKKGGGIMSKLFSSHPQLEERIKALENLNI